MSQSSSQVNSAAESNSENRHAAYPAIKDLAAIGNGHTVALVSRIGSVEWWCPGRFDHPSVFASILDRTYGGRFDLAVGMVDRTEQTYISDTNVLRTLHYAQTGVLEVVDFMPVAGGDDELRPHHALMRRVRCIGGSVSLRAQCAPRFRYGEAVPHLRRISTDCVRFAEGHEALVLRSDSPLEIAGRTAKLDAALSDGQSLWMSLSYADADPVIIAPIGDAAEALLSASVDYWRSWAQQCAYTGPYRDAVVRSALVLKMLLFAPSGALVAAPTTSLPEDPGGERNWDYRYCWLRDSSLATRALLRLGYLEEVRAYLSWILHATYLTWPVLKVAYDVYGRDRIPERELPHLEGYLGSRPVRIGNEAAEQFQLDAFAEVISAAHEFVTSGGELASGQLKRLIQLGKKVIELWQQPDNGIWEIRANPRHYVHSKVMCWRALDDLVTMHEHGHVKAPFELFRKVCEQIRADIEANGFDVSLGSYVQAYESRIADASLLTLPIVGYVPADDPRMQGTFEFLREHLETNGLWYRYPLDSDDALPGTEATFGICSFLAADVLARAGRVAEAESLFEHLLSLSSGTGLYAEQIDAKTGAAIGNFPQGFTHIGLINAALSIEEARRTES